MATLDDKARAALYTFVCDSATPVTREQAAQAVGISRKLAAFHLDKLVAAGLLDAHIEAVGARRVGRTPKVYRRSADDVQVCLPQREHGMLADILLGAVIDEQPGERAGEAAVRVAHERGVATGAAERDRLRPGRLGAERALALTQDVLERQGFQPRRDGDGVHLRNCPFHPLAEAQPDLVCGLNQAYLQGVVEGLQSDGVIAALPAPAADGCCVQLRCR